MLRIKQLREEKKLSQLEFAKKINLTQQSISLYEKGDREPSLDVLVSISDFFHVSTDYLLGKSNLRNPEKIIRNHLINSSIKLNVNGLNKEEIEIIKQQIEYLKWKKKLKQ